MLNNIYIPFLPSLYTVLPVSGKIRLGKRVRLEGHVVEGELVHDGLCGGPAAARVGLGPPLPRPPPKLGHRPRDLLQEQRGRRAEHRRHHQRRDPDCPHLRRQYLHDSIDREREIISSKAVTDPSVSVSTSNKEEWSSDRIRGHVITDFFLRMLGSGRSVV